MFQVDVKGVSYNVDRQKRSFLGLERNSCDCLHRERMGDDRQSSGFQFSINHLETSARGVNRTAAVSGT